MRRILGYFSLGLLGLLVLSLAVTGYLLHSEKGSRWLVDRLPQWVPGELVLGGFEGSFTGPLSIRDLSYRDGDLSVEIERLRFDWRPTELFEWRLYLSELYLRGGRLRLPVAQASREPEPQARPFAGISLPLDVVVDTLNIENVRILQASDAEPIVIEQLMLQAEAGQQRVSIARLEATAFSAHLEVNGVLRLSRGLPVELQTRWSYQLPDGPELLGQGEVSGNLQTLHVQQTLAAPIGGVLDATLFELEQEPRWESRLELDKTDIGVFVEGFPARLSGHLESHGTPHKVQASGRLGLFEPSLGQLNAQFRSLYANGVVEAEQLLVSTPEGLKLEAKGRYTPDPELGTLDVDLKWSDLRWPLSGERIDFLSKDGSLYLQGQPKDYRYRLDLDTRLPDLPHATGRLDAAGSGNLQGLVLEALNLRLQEGRLKGRGRVAWQPQPDWQLQLEGEDIDPGVWDQAFPGKLSLILHTQGQVRETVPHAELNLQRLDGELRGYPLRATGNASLAGEQLTIKRVNLHSGANRLDLQGSAGKSLDLSWVLEAPELAALWPDLSGALNAKGRVSGKTATPKVQATLQGKQLAFQENRVAELEGEVDLGLDESQRIDLRLQAQELTLGDRTWDQLEINAEGLRANHQITMQLLSRESPQLTMGLNAGLDEAFAWRGELRKLNLELHEFGRWDLQSTAPFFLGQKSQGIENICFRSAGAVLCGSFHAEQNKGMSGTLEGTDLPFSMFQSRLPEQIRINGGGNLTAEFVIPDGGVIRGNANLEITNGDLGFELGGEPQRIDFSGGLLSAGLDSQAGQGKLQLPLVGLGGIEGQVSLPGLNPFDLDLKKQTLVGQIGARIENLDLVSVLLPNLQNVKGAVNADFKFDGTLAAPGLQGGAKLQGGAMDVPELGLRLRDLELQLSASDLDRMSLSGSVRSGKGRLELSGETRLNHDKGFPTELRVAGENWVAVDIPEAEVHVSPDVKIKHSNERSELSGKVHLPYARIRPRELPKGAVSGSSDLVLIGADDQQESKTDPNFYSKLRISFGDKVNFEGMGLRGNLTGNLLVTDEPGRPVTGSGRVGVVDGTYKAYGQDLKVERGYALFADSPVDNPGLDVRAVREVEDITAGLRVTGTLKKPQLSLFSTPSMSEAEVLSYLLTGRAPGEAGGANLGVSAALQAAGAGSLASEIGRQVGLDELRVDTGSTLEEASVVAGTYLSPRLYVQYVNELATRETKLRLRYDLTRKLQIQTESGQSQGVDIFYTIER